MRRLALRLGEDGRVVAPAELAGPGNAMTLRLRLLTMREHPVLLMSCVNGAGH